MKPPKENERSIHTRVVTTLGYRGKAGLFYFHTPNEGKRHIFTAMGLKKLGVVAGVPDLMLFYDGKFYGLELKAKGGKLSWPQLEVSAKIKTAGGEHEIAYGYDEAVKILEQWELIK